MTRFIVRVFTVLILGWAGNTVAAPITGADILKVDGTEWAQVDIFIGLSWSDLNAVCPGGLCLSGGELNGYDMTGWRWAVTDDVNALFNYYIGSRQMGPGPDSYQIFPGAFAAEFFGHGWRKTDSFFPGDSRETFGLVSDNSSTIAYIGEWINVTDIANTDYNLAGSSDVYGGWFYRGNSPQIPIPATIPLIGVALAILGFGRRKSS